MTDESLISAIRTEVRDRDDQWKAISDVMIVTNSLLMIIKSHEVKIVDLEKRLHRLEASR
jgi:hypothetical protein